MFIAATTTSSWLVTTLSMTFIHDRFTSSLSPTQAIPCHHKTNVSRVDRHRKGPPELVWQCQAILLQFVLLVILSRQKLKRRTTKNGEAAGNKVRQPHHPSQLLRRKRCTLTEVLRPSHLVRRKRCTNHVPIRPLDAFNAMSEALSQLSLFPVADPWATILSLRTCKFENMQECCWRLGFRQ